MESAEIDKSFRGKTILTGNELPAYLHGALTCVKTAQGVIPYRFPENFRDYVEMFENYAASAAGIHLSFETDASSVRLDCAVVQTCDTTVPAAFDVLVNGVLRHHDFAVSEGEQTVSFDLKAPGNVDIWFPYQAEVELRSLELLNASYCKKTDENRKKCLFLGDSITQGSTCEYPSLTIAATLSRALDLELLNQGIGGYSHRKSFVQQQNFTPDVIFVALGTNDPSWQQPECRDVYGFYERLNALYPEVPTAIITPYKRYREFDREKMNEIIDQIRECACKRPNTTLIYGRDISAHIPSFYSDGLHPNTMGTQFIAAQLLRELKALDF